MNLKQISIFKYSIAIMFRQTSRSGAKWSQDLPEPYFCFLPWAAAAALSHFPVPSSALGFGCPLRKGSSWLKMQRG